MTEPDGYEITAQMKQLEFLGHEVLTMKKTIIELDRTRHKNREAWRAIKKQNELLQINSDAQKKVPMFVSPKMFVRFPTAEAETRLKKAVNDGDEEIEQTRKELKEKVNDLRTFEGKQDLKELGFDLKPVTSRFFVEPDLL